MAQPKGSTGNPNGRPKGVPNKATTLAREAIARFVDSNVDRLNEWLEAIATGKMGDTTIGPPNPKDAYNCLVNVMEYHLPKRARTEITGDDGGPIKQSVEVRFVDTETK